MALYSDCGLPLKIFVKEQNIVTKDEKTFNKNYLPVKPLTGESAKEFYESVISEPAISKPKSHAEQLGSANRSNFNSVGLVNQKKLKNMDLHKLAQNNEFETLERVLRDNRDIAIDAVDSFGWTPLMCATCSCSRETVEVLLRNKANPNLCDKFGNSALSLAKMKNFDIIELMKKLDSSQSLQKKKRSKPIGSIFCDMCKCEFHTDMKTHESSTLHLFNSRHKNTRTFYGIPDCNRGFQLLLKSGWNREKGLGPKECGMKFPVKVKKKNDRIGIGGTTIKSANETGGNNMFYKQHRNKKAILSQEKKEKYFERNYRLQFL